jgi:molecular chaperone GrpE
MNANETQATPNPASAGEETPEQVATHVLEDLEQLRSKAEERDKFLELLRRTQADFENYQKRARRDAEEDRKYAVKPLAVDLLPALDNLERALTAVKEESPLSKGVAMVQTQLVEALKRHNIKRIEAVGQPFDPNLHQAVMQQPAADKPPNTVLQILEHGYTLHDRVLRPCKVILSKEVSAEG